MAAFPIRTLADTNASADINTLAKEGLNNGGFRQLDGDNAIDDRSVSPLSATGYLTNTGYFQDFAGDVVATLTASIDSDVKKNDVVITSALGNSNFRYGEKIDDVSIDHGVRVIMVAEISTTAGTGTIEAKATQDFGSGGSGDVNISSNEGAYSIPAATTKGIYAWTIDMPSVDGKTIGAGHHINYFFTNGASATEDITIHRYRIISDPAELVNIDNLGLWLMADEPRLIVERNVLSYFERIGNEGVSTQIFGTGSATSTTQARIEIKFTQKLIRAITSNPDYAGTFQLIKGAAVITVTTMTVLSNSATTKNLVLTVNVAAGLTAGDFYQLRAGSDGTAYIDIDPTY